MATPKGRLPMIPLPKAPSDLYGSTPSDLFQRIQRGWRAAGKLLAVGQVMQKNSTSAERRTRILIADNHTTFAETCRSILEPEFEVFGVVLDGSKLAQSVAKLKPDIVVIDMLMPPLTGFELAAQVRATRPKAKIIHMTVAADFDSAAESFRCGASAYVTKISFPTDLREAVRRVIRGDLYLSSTIGPQSQRTYGPEAFSKVSAWLHRE